MISCQEHELRHHLNQSNYTLLYLRVVFVFDLEQQPPFFFDVQLSLFRVFQLYPAHPWLEQVDILLKMLHQEYNLRGYRRQHVLFDFSFRFGLRVGEFHGTAQI